MKTSQLSRRAQVILKILECRAMIWTLRGCEWTPAEELAQRTYLAGLSLPELVHILTVLSAVLTDFADGLEKLQPPV